MAAFGAMPRPIALMTSGNFMALIGSYEPGSPHTTSTSPDSESMWNSFAPDASRSDFAVAPFEPIRTAILSFGIRGNPCRMYLRLLPLFFNLVVEALQQ